MAKRRRSGLWVGVRGVGDVQARLAEMGNPGALEAVPYQHGQAVMAEVIESHVPRMDSDLANSGYVSEPTRDGGDIVVKIGFRAAHARATHENPRAGRTGGVSPSGRRYKKWAKVGHWKYLSQPLAASVPAFRRAVVEVIESAFGGRSKRVGRAGAAFVRGMRR